MDFLAHRAVRWRLVDPLIDRRFDSVARCLIRRCVDWPVRRFADFWAIRRVGGSAIH